MASYALVNCILEVRWLGPLTDLTRGSAEDADGIVRPTDSHKHVSRYLLSLEEDNEQVEKLREVEEDKEATEPVALLGLCGKRNKGGRTGSMSASMTIGRCTSD